MGRLCFESCFFFRGALKLKEEKKHVVLADE